MRPAPVALIGSRPGRPAAPRPYPAFVTAQPDGREKSADAAPTTGGAPGEPASARVAEVERLAQERWLERQRRNRLLLWPLIMLVELPLLHGSPPPGAHGKALVVSVCMAAFFLSAGAIASGGGVVFRVPQPLVLPLVLVVGASGVGLIATQLSVASELPVAAAVAMAFLSLPTRRAAWVGVLVAAGAAVADLKSGNSTSTGAASIVLLCVTLALMGTLVRRSWESQIETERLAAQLEDANEERAAAAALAERARIARDLHDVLAQSLSGLAIQLEAARRVARRDGVERQLRDLLDQAAGLTREGLTEARRAVAALRGDSTASLEQLPGLVERYRVDLRLDVSLEVTGRTRTLSALASEALLRGAQEALTNAARYARTSTVRVQLRYEDAATVLCVQDSRPPGVETPAPLVTGSGMGLKGMAERIGQAGGRIESGPAADGWRVVMEIPA